MFLRKISEIEIDSQTEREREIEIERERDLLIKKSDFLFECSFLTLWHF